MEEREFNNKIDLVKLRGIFRTPSISPLQKCILSDLSFYAGIDGEAFPSQQTLANNQGCSTRQVRNCLVELKRLGIISWKKRGYSKSNRYAFNKELYFRNRDRNRKFTSAHSGQPVPLQTGNPVPPNVSQERNQLSSNTLQLFEQVAKRKAGRIDNFVLNKLASKFSEDWITDAIREAGKRNYPYLRVNLISLILGDWKEAGKPPPKPIFTACGKDGCDNGFITNTNRDNYRICGCRKEHEEKLALWKKEWGGVR